jgi:O-antigen/teichoic acid export membrane protein
MDMTIGAFCFGVVIGWVTYRTLRRREGAAALSDISAVISALGGAAIMAIFRTSELFGIYCIGLFVGFFLYLIVSLNLKDENVGKWLGN